MAASNAIESADSVKRFLAVAEPLVSDAPVPSRRRARKLQRLSSGSVLRACRIGAAAGDESRKLLPCQQANPFTTSAGQAIRRSVVGGLFLFALLRRFDTNFFNFSHAHHARHRFVNDIDDRIFHDCG